MIIGYLVAIAIALYGYLNSKKIIREKYQNVGLVQSGLFRYPARAYRDGKDAVTVGKWGKYFSVFFLVVTLTEMIGLHQLTFYFFVFSLVIYNTVFFVLYPIKYDPPKDAKKENSTP